MKNINTIGLVKKDHIELHRSGESNTETINSIKGTIDGITVWPWNVGDEKKVIDIHIEQIPREGTHSVESIVLRVPLKWHRTRELLLGLISVGDHVRDSLVSIIISEKGVSVSRMNSDGGEHPQDLSDKLPDVSTKDLVPRIYGYIVGPVDIDFETE